MKQAKYKIAELLRLKYGELGLQKGIEELQSYCKLKNRRTVAEWLKIEAGSPIAINHLVINWVLDFFELQNESQLFTDEHKQLLKEAA